MRALSKFGNFFLFFLKLLKSYWYLKLRFVSSEPSSSIPQNELTTRIESIGNCNIFIHFLFLFDPVHRIGALLSSIKILHFVCFIRFPFCFTLVSDNINVVRELIVCTALAHSLYRTIIGYCTPPPCSIWAGNLLYIVISV